MNSQILLLGCTLLRGPDQYPLPTKRSLLFMRCLNEPIVGAKGKYVYFYKQNK